jgi:hypothetical protein
MNHTHARRAVARLGLVVTALGLFALCSTAAEQTPPATPTVKTPELCPMLGWPELLPSFIQPKADFPTNDTPVDAPDCAFHQWSWEAFAWATAVDDKGVPRFMKLHTPEDLFKSDAEANGPHTLTLATRATHAFGDHVEGAGAIVEADGNMLVASNGYPVYASVHMNDAYFATVKKNMIVNGGYQSNVGADEFPVGAAVFKAMWLRLDVGQQPPAGAFVTQAQVPILTEFLSADNTIYVTPSGRTTTVTVALIGLHVVGHTINHPEFLWGTFEHKSNSPRFPDGTFNPQSTASNPQSYTLYQGGTAYNQTNIPSTQTTATSTATPLSAPSTVITTTVTMTPNITFNPQTQRFSPANNVVLANQTGSETFSPKGPANIAALNQAAHTFYAKQKAPLNDFANYDLIGTVWMAPNTYNLSSNQSNALGSVNLSNSTAETFEQNLTGTTTPATMQNCFSCHNPDTFQNVAPLPNLTARKVAQSHVLAAGTMYAVPNLLAVAPPPGSGGTTKGPTKTAK